MIVEEPRNPVDREVDIQQYASNKGSVVVSSPLNVKNAGYH
jgi:hypothetical protein